MMNRKDISQNLITFEDFKAGCFKVGQHLELPMGGPYTAKRFVVASVAKHLHKPDMVVCEARAIAYYKGYEADVVAGTVKKCGSVVAHVVYDEACELYYVGDKLEEVTAFAGSSECLEEAMKEFFEH